MSISTGGRWKISDDDLITDLRRVHAEQGRISVAVYDEHGTYSAGTVIRHFGKWSDGVKAANLPASATGRRAGSYNVSTADLLAHIDSVLGDAEHVPVRTYDAAGKYSSVTVIRRFGSWHKALDARRRYVEITKAASGGASAEQILSETGYSEDEVLDIFSSWEALSGHVGGDFPANE